MVVIGVAGGGVALAFIEGEGFGEDIIRARGETVVNGNAVDRNPHGTE